MNARFGLNPLPWVLTPAGFDLSVPVLRRAFGEIVQTPFRGIQADPPVELSPDEYGSLLAEFGLEPAPGYFAADFATQPVAVVVEAARRHAAYQAALGNTEVFIASDLAPARVELPAVGAAADEGRLQMIIEKLGAAAELMIAEGVRPALHPHVGTWIEVEPEVEAVLAAIPDGILGFGPDTGHLAWAGMDVAAVIGRHADRVAGVHLKDYHRAEADAARGARTDYFGSTTGPFRIWTEPGRGDVDLAGALASLPADYSGWIMVEVDVPEAPTNLESTRISAQWVEDRFPASVFGGRPDPADVR